MDAVPRYQAIFLTQFTNAPNKPAKSNNLRNFTDPYLRCTCTPPLLYISDVILHKDTESPVENSGERMKLHLTSAYQEHSALDALIRRAHQDSLQRHQLTSSPDEADAILFVENAQFDDYLYDELASHELALRYPEKTFMYNEADTPWPVLPGLYCCMSGNHFDHTSQIASPYITTPNPFVKYIHSWNAEKRWLYSFVGSSSHRCRKAVLALSEQCGGVMDTSEFDAWNCTEADRHAQGWKFAEHMAQSQFVLCPRGLGPSSARLFEALEAGIAPVIISDQWVPPPHIDWSFAVRVREDQIHTIPARLAAIANESDDRGRAAREAWDLAYAPDRLFNTMAESVGCLLDMRSHTNTLPKPVLANTRRLVVSSEVRLRQMARVCRELLGPEFGRAA
jgi:hypothetical protein